LLGGGGVFVHALHDWT